MAEEREYIYWLIHVPGFGPRTISGLKDVFFTYEAIYEAEREALIHSGAVTERQCEALLAEKETLEERRRELEKLCKRGVRFLTIHDEEYPGRLLSISDPPTALFLKGGLPPEEAPAAAIVGARECSEYGQWAAGSFAELLAAEGVQIISGLALGVDGAAHNGALRAGKQTFAVMGCGIHTCYPRENYALYRQIEEQGGVMTEFPPYTAPQASNFPRRNRIISGLSDAVIIIEAREKSGSLITADYALEQGKEVFALPGRITDVESGGCNRLLQSGASLCLSPADVLEYFGIRRERKLTLHKFSEKRLANREKVLYSFLDSRPRHVEQIMQASGMQVTECMELLLKLELMGAVRACGNQFYCRRL